MVDYTLLHFKEYLYEQLNIKYNSDSSLAFKQLISACVPAYLKKNELSNEETERIKLYARQLIMAQTPPQEIIETLIDNTPEYNFPYPKKEFKTTTPLIEAMLYGDVKTAKQLIKNKVDVNEKVHFSNNDYAPLDVAFNLTKHRGLFTRILLNAGAQAKNTQVLLYAVDTNDIPFAEELVREHDCDVMQDFLIGTWGNCVDFSPLMVAAKHDNVEMLKTLIALGARVNSYQGYEALNMAAKEGHTNTLQYLLDIRLEARGGPNCDKSPLSCAAESGQTEIIDFLLNQDVPINYVSTSTGNTPLMLAIENNHMDTAKKLIERGADVMHRNMDGKTALNLLSMINNKTPLHHEVENMIQSKIKALSSLGNGR